MQIFICLFCFVKNSVFLVSLAQTTAISYYITSFLLKIFKFFISLEFSKMLMKDIAKSLKVPSFYQANFLILTVRIRKRTCVNQVFIFGFITLTSSQHFALALNLVLITWSSLLKYWSESFLMCLGIYI